MTKTTQESLRALFWIVFSLITLVNLISVAMFFAQYSTVFIDAMGKSQRLGFIDGRNFGLYIDPNYGGVVSICVDVSDVLVSAEPPTLAGGEGPSYWQSGAQLYFASPRSPGLAPRAASLRQWLLASAVSTQSAQRRKVTRVLAWS
jgi:hypothetical protein